MAYYNYVPVCAAKGDPEWGRVRVRGEQGIGGHVASSELRAKVAAVAA